MPASWTNGLPGAWAELPPSSAQASGGACRGGRASRCGAVAKFGEQTLALVADVGGVSVATHALALAVLGTRASCGFRNGDRKAQMVFQLSPISTPCPPAYPRGLVLPLWAHHPWAPGSKWVLVAFFSVTRTPAMSQVSKHSWVGLAGF